MPSGTGCPSTTGLTPTTGADVPRSAPRTPGTPRTMPSARTGSLGGSRTTSASRMASSTPGAAAARSRPATTKRATCGPPSSRRHCCTWTACWSSPSSTTACVSTGTSLIGRTRTVSGTRRPRAIRSVTSLRLSPRASHAVRAMCTAISASVAGYQSGVRPSSPSPSVTVWAGCGGVPFVLPRASTRRSRSGQSRRPQREMSSPVLAMTVTSAPASSAVRSRCSCRRRTKWAPGSPPEMTVMRMRSSSQERRVGGAGADRSPLISPFGLTTHV